MMRKYRNVPTEVDGITFASKREARRYGELRLQLKAGWIKDLELQPRFHCIVNGLKVCDYVGDFLYTNSAGENVVEDVKGIETREFKLKRKLMKACHKIDVVTV